MQKDFGFDMLCAYVDLHRTCERLFPLIEAAADTLASFAAVAGYRRRAFFSGVEYCPILDPVTPEERARRSEQSAKAREKGRLNRGDGGWALDAPRSFGADCDDIRPAYGTYDDFRRNPLRYPDDFFEPKAPWER